MWANLYKAVTPRTSNDDVQRMIQSYRQAHNITTPEYGSVNKLDHANSQRIADAYHALQHEPQHPNVRASYDALKRETLQQFQHLLKHGYKFSRWEKEGEPYGDSAEMMDDVRSNRHMHYFPTVGEGEVGGFGSKEDEVGSDHPLLDTTGYYHHGKPLLYNDVFRIVHDVFGHAADGHQFGPLGEENAWRKHSSMYSAQAQPALTSETRGQNSWVNFGQHIRRPDGSIPKKGEPDWVHPADRPFADQKAGLLPKEFWHPAPAVTKSVIVVRLRKSHRSLVHS